MKTQKVDVPEELVALLQRSRLATRPLAEQVKFALAVLLFQEGIISVGKAAKLVGEPRASFELLLGEMGIPPVRYTLEMYEEDLRGFAAAQARHLERVGRPLRLDADGFAQLRDRLHEANADNPQFETQYVRLAEVLQTILSRLQEHYGDQLERVMAVGVWTQEGIDLRSLPCEEVVLEIVLRSSERPFELYWQIAEKVFADLKDEDILVQFRLETLPEWEHALSLARSQGREESLGIPLLTRG